MRLTITGATGLIGSALVARLRDEGAELTVLTRDVARAQAALSVPAFPWDPGELPPLQALEGRDAVINLAGENIAQRWSARAKRAITDSRVRGTQSLLAALGKLDGATRPRVLVNASAAGYYGPHGEEPLDEDAPAGEGFLAELCVAWETQALCARELGMRVSVIRTGVVLDARGGALAKMLAPFRLGLGGPVGGGEQYMSWIHTDDVVGILIAALASERFTGAINATAPEPVTNREFSRALGRALHRPALVPVPALALRARYGEMAQVITTGARVLPARALVLGYRFEYPRLDGALSDVLG